MYPSDLNRVCHVQPDPEGKVLIDAIKQFIDKPDQKDDELYSMIEQMIDQLYSWDQSVARAYQELTQALSVVLDRSFTELNLSTDQNILFLLCLACFHEGSSPLDWIVELSNRNLLSKRVLLLVKRDYSSKADLMSCLLKWQAILSQGQSDLLLFCLIREFIHNKPGDLSSDILLERLYARYRSKHIDAIREVLLFCFGKILVGDRSIDFAYETMVDLIKKTPMNNTALTAVDRSHEVIFQFLDINQLNQPRAMRRFLRIQSSVFNWGLSQCNKTI